MIVHKRFRCAHNEEDMKPAQIFYQYTWIINTLRTYRKLTFDIRPTADILGHLLSYGDGIELHQQQELREKMPATDSRNS